MILGIVKSNRSQGPLVRICVSISHGLPVLGDSGNGQLIRLS